MKKIVTQPHLYLLLLLQKVYCDSYKCPYGYALVDDAAYMKCKWGKCDKSQSCDKVISSYDCPKYYELVDDADDTVCKNNKCTKDQCCEKGEACFESIPHLGLIIRNMYHIRSTTC